MFETHTYDDPIVLDPKIRARWAFLETSSAAAVLRSVCPTEWMDITAVLAAFALDPSRWLKKGGNRGDNIIEVSELLINVPNTLDGRQGDDILKGGNAGDTYAFSAGYDFDTIIEKQDHAGAIDPGRGQRGQVVLLRQVQA